MSDLDVRALEANFKLWKSERAPDLSESKAFERYVFEQVLKDHDLSDEDIDIGDFGGADDGGIDGMYLFMNTYLIGDETPAPVPAGAVVLHIIQAKLEKSFTEGAIEKLDIFAHDLLAYHKPIEDLKYLNTKAREAIRNFREKYDAAMGAPHTLTVNFHYACKATAKPGPNDKISIRANNLRDYVRSMLSFAQVNFVPWTSWDILAATRDVPEARVKLPVTKSFSADDGSTVALVKLTDFAREMLMDKNGQLQTRYLEPNVRDYAGASNPVNRQIHDTLEKPNPGEEFWWLNNGITVLASECFIGGNKASISNPEIVNGLQTSHEIFYWYTNKKGADDARNVLLRIILPTDERTRTRIIKATNSQTKVDDLSLMSTERIHEDIEDKLKLYGLFYDRKKGEYRRLKKPISKIIGMVRLAQAVMSIYLQEPNQARGRPRTYAKANPAKVFDTKVDRDIYAACILIDRQVEQYIGAKKELPSDTRTDIRHHVAMAVACELTGEAKPTAKGLSEAVPKCISPIPVTTLESCTATVLDLYGKLGATDVIAKGTALRDQVLSHIKTTTAGGQGGLF